MSGIGNSFKLISASGESHIDGILTGRAWADSTIKFSFPTSSSEYSSPYYDSEPTTGFGAISALQQTAALFALDADSGPAASYGFSVEGFTTTSFEYTTDAKAHVRLANSDVPSTAYAFLPGPNYDEAGDVWFGPNYNFGNAQVGNYQYHTLIHEIGHALGLDHSHEGSVEFPALSAQWDHIAYTVMSYRSYESAPLTGYTYEIYGAPQTWMMLDIAALQEMYGADFTTNSGDTVYKWDPNSGDTLIDGQVAIDAVDSNIFATVWDGDGNDTYDLSAYTTSLNIDLAPGASSTFSSAQQAYLGNGNRADNIYNALQHNGDARSLIENAIGGTGNDVISGNTADNVLTGGEGNDTLTGLDGNDTLIGGEGMDSLFGGDGNDTFVYVGGRDLISAGGGVDTLDASQINTTTWLNLNNPSSQFKVNDGGWQTRGDVSGVENFISGSGDDYFYGDANANVFNGGDGNDLFNGGANEDTFILGGVFADYTFSGSSSNAVITGTSGIDTLIDVEFVDIGGVIYEMDFLV